LEKYDLGLIISKLEKLEDASKHPDLGPVGDGLITLMDQKLSKLDDRLYELSSKISTASITVPEIKKEKTTEVETSKQITEPKQESKIQNKIKTTFNFEKSSPSKSEPVIIPPTKTRQSFELTTLTRFSKKEPKFPLFEKQVPVKEEIVAEITQPKPKIQNKIEVVQTPSPAKTEVILESKPDLAKEMEKITKFKALPEPAKEKPQPSVNLEDEFDDDSDDIDKIKGEIMSVLSKLDQAEVE
jgi:hypothetical protein